MEEVFGKRRINPRCPRLSQDDWHATPATRRRHRTLTLHQEDPTRFCQPRESAAHFGDVSTGEHVQATESVDRRRSRPQVRARSLRRNTMAPSPTGVTSENAVHPALDKVPMPNGRLTAQNYAQ